MNYKNWPYWVKGLSTGFVIGLFILAIALYPWNSALVFWIVLAAMYPGVLLGGPLLFGGGLPHFLYLPIINVVAYSIIGAVIGYLYGKIKNRQKVI